MPHPLFQQLGREILVGSGAIGTCLRGESAAVELVEILNVRNPDAVRRLHTAYQAAGAQILVTNTFAANALFLAETHMAGQVAEINRCGVRLARDVAGRACMVWGSVGPLALGLRYDDYPERQIARIFHDHCAALKEADALVLETFTDAREARLALEAAAATGLPVVFQIGQTGGGRDRWSRIDALLDLAVRAGASAVGANCRHPNEIVDVAAYLAAHTRLPVTAAPNAGHPAIDRGLVRYDFRPEDLASVGGRLAEAGAAVIGGCCGTTPDHIRHLSEAIAGRPVGPRPAVSESVTAAPAAERAVPRRHNRIRALMRGDRFLISVEIRADRKRSLAQIAASAGEIAAAGADLFDVPDNPGATVGRDAMVVAARLQEEWSVPAFCHKAVTQSNLIALHSYLIGCWDSGLDGILAVTGDPPSMGHLANMARLVGDLRSSVELLRLVHSLRDGHMINQEEVADAPDLCAGCALGQPKPAQFNWLKRKVEAGAEFVFSQPVFSFTDFELLRDGIGREPIRFFPGVMPLTSRKNAEFLAGGRIPGIRVPQEIVDRLGRFSSAEDQRRCGLELATELALRIARAAQGLYLIMPFGRHCYTDTATLVREVRAATA